MLLIDDLLLSPARGLLWVFRKVHEAAQEEMAGEQEAITTELRELYMMLETGRISEADFDARERVLLDRLDSVRAREPDSIPENEEEGEEGEDQDQAEQGEDSDEEQDEESGDLHPV